MNPNVGTTVTRVRDFIRLNPPKFNPSEVKEDIQECIDDAYKVLMIISVMSMKNAELAAYQHKGIFQVWFNQWKEERVIDAGHVDWEKLKNDVLYKFFPLEMM
ncbi:hypothetical protein MTR67_023181 [Solanum verrucosum]|uniref:Uncharacterized protein n=1 Tax=Solanum verrucosum TaxID=315347 RepID=A0AAF0TRL3_SOLVR|nr:hypothetical protein MTR67_023181 [Solanum verrucosum]